MKATEIKTPADARSYNLAARGPTRYGPMVCVCEEPDARADRDFGMCARCKRKPLSLMTRPS